MGRKFNCDSWRLRTHLFDIIVNKSWAHEQCVGGVAIYISFNFEDEAYVEALQASLFMLEPYEDIIPSRAAYGAVMYNRNIKENIFQSDAFLLLIGPSGATYLQQLEFGLARKRRVKNADFPIVPVITEPEAGRPAFLFDTPCFELPVITDRERLRELISKLNLPQRLTAKSKPAGLDRTIWPSR